MGVDLDAGRTDCPAGGKATSHVRYRRSMGYFERYVGYRWDEEF